MTKKQFLVMLVCVCTSMSAHARGQGGGHAHAHKPPEIITGHGETSHPRGAHKGLHFNLAPGHDNVGY